VFSSDSPNNRANLYGYYYSQLQDLESALTYLSCIQFPSLENIQQTAFAYLSSESDGITIVYFTDK
jgi:predicted Zn-dependent peptidase